MQLAKENTPRKQSPVAKNWMERSCSKVRAVTLPVPLHNNQYALLADDDDNIDNEELPTTATAYSVLDHDTGETLEHIQLQRLPKYKATWDTSYADEIGRLCHGVRKHPTKPNTQQVAGTNTMKPIKYQDIHAERRRDVTHTVGLLWQIQVVREDT